jgi:DNA-binding transcriptional MerR regulator
VLAANHAAIAAHETLRELLGQDTVSTGIYCAQPVSGAQVLTDVHRLAVGLFRTASPETLVRGFGHRQSTAEIRFWSDRVWQQVPGRGLRPVRFAAGAPAPVVCAGATAALRILLCGDLTSAAAALRRIASSARPRIPPTLAFRGHYASSALCAVDILSCANGWDPIETLRFCVYARLPRHPTLLVPADHDLTLRATPTLMWADWALALAPCISGRLAWTTQRQLLSWLLLEVGSRRSESSIQAGLRVKIERKRVHEAAVAMSRRHSWDQLATALTQLHDHLVQHPPPIDYQRRRELDYSRLLTSKQWLAICARAAVRTRSDWLCDTAREWLSERLSAAPASARGATEGRRALAWLLMVLTPELKRELDSHAIDFLHRHRIADEPVVWSPPRAIREHCALPRAAHEALTITDLHAVLDRPHAGIYEASRQLGVPIHGIRYLLEEHPLPTRRKRHPTNAQRFRDACDDRELRRLYLDECLTLDEISQRFGIPAGPHVAERARACGIPLRHEARKPIDAQWLWEQHVIRRQTLSEIAAESGDTISRIRYWAKQHEIPITRYRRRQLNLDVLQQARELHVEKLLNPLRSDKQGWQRLQRFAAMSSYPTFVAAARAIGCRADTLSTQIAALEDDFGERLVERAVHQKKSMRLTDFGARVVKAVQAIQRRLAVI